MTIIARLEITPVGEESMTERIATAIEALDDFDIQYELTPTDTVIEAESVHEVFEAAAAAHDAVTGGRVITSIEVDDQGGRDQKAHDRVAAVEEQLGRPPRSDA